MTPRCGCLALFVLLAACAGGGGFASSNAKSSRGEKNVVGTASDTSATGKGGSGSAEGATTTAPPPVDDIAIESAKPAAEVAGAFLTLACDRAPEAEAQLPDDAAAVGCGFFDGAGDRGDHQPTITAVSLAYSDGGQDEQPALVAAAPTSRWQAIVPVSLRRAGALKTLVVTADGNPQGISIPFKPSPAEHPVIVTREPVALAVLHDLRKDQLPSTCAQLRLGVHLLSLHSQCNSHCRQRGKGGRFQGCNLNGDAECLCFDGDDQAVKTLETPLSKLDRVAAPSQCAQAEAADGQTTSNLLGFTSACAHPGACLDHVLPKGTSGLGFAVECGETQNATCLCVGQTSPFATLVALKPILELNSTDTPVKPGACQSRDPVSAASMDLACDRSCTHAQFVGGWAAECSQHSETYCVCVR